MPPPPRRPLRPPAGIARTIVQPISPPAPIAPSVLPVSPITAPLVPVIVPAVDLAPPAPTRARFDALIAELHQLRDQMNRSVHRCGTILNELSTDAMLAFGEVTDFGELLVRYDLPSRVSATKYMAVAHHFTADQAATLGVERAYLIIRGAAARPRPIAPSLLLAENPTIHVGPESAKLADASFRILLGWVTGLAPSAPAADLKREAKAADSLRDKLQRRFVSAAIGKPKMQVRKRGGAYVVKVELTMDEATALLAAVRKTS